MQVEAQKLGAIFPLAEDVYEAAVNEDEKYAQLQATLTGYLPAGK